MGALALIAGLRPDLIEPLLPTLHAMVVTDKSVIVRDQATAAIANYAGSGPAAAAAVPILIQILDLDHGRFASRALHGLRHAVAAKPELAETLLAIAGSHLDHHRKVARDAAKQLVRAIEEA